MATGSKDNTSEQGDARRVELAGLPCDEAAERAILGGMLLDNQMVYEAEEHMSGVEFGLESHRRIYAVIADLSNAGSPADIITVPEKLRIKGQLESVGGVAYLASLTDGTIHRSSILHYIKIVREKFLLRQLIAIANRTMLRAFEQSDPVDEQYADVQQSLIDSIQLGRNVGVNLQQAGREWLAKMEEIRRLEPGTVVGVPTPLPELDDLTTGFRKNEVCVFAAKAGGGKTAIMCQGVRRQIQLGYKPGVFSIEVPRDQIITRLACMESSLNVFDARDNRVMNQVQYDTLLEAGAKVAMEWDFFLEDGRMTPKRLAAITRSWVSKGCDCIWVDHLLKLASRAPGKTEYERVTSTIELLWDLARFTGVPINVLHHIKRGAGMDEEPNMEDLRASGEIENNAHLIVLIHRPVTLDDTGARHSTGEDKLIIPKQRSGPSNVHLPVRFNGPVGIFETREKPGYEAGRTTETLYR